MITLRRKYLGDVFYKSHCRSQHQSTGQTRFYTLVWYQLQEPLFLSRFIIDNLLNGYKYATTFAKACIVLDAI